MRRFLYLSPYFPPQTKVGALRPLKFARHLPEQGWAPVVLADLGPSDNVDEKLHQQVPESCDVVWDYSARAAVAWRRLRERGWERPRRRRSGLLKRALSRVPPPRPELLPLGEHSPRIPHALRAARKLLARRPCEAIVVNADPYAACLVGRQVGNELGLPVIHDLRDPWALCDLRRPLRPAPQRILEDWLERRCVEDCARFVLNTRAARDAYREFYRDIPEERFDYIRNHSDPELIHDGVFEPRERFTVLYIGNFRRFVEGDVLLQVLAELKRRGHCAGELCLLVTGQLTDDVRRRARRLGVEAMLEDHPYVPYRQVGALMEIADVLISLSPPSQLRIPAKLYDYGMSDRPLVVVTENPEVVEIASALEGTHMHGLGEPQAIADSIEEELRLGRQRRVDRRATGLDSATASARLAAILDEVTENGAPSRTRSSC